MQPRGSRLIRCDDHPCRTAQHTLRVDGHAVTESIVFTSAPISKGKTSQTLGLPGLEGYLWVAVIVGAVVIAVAILVLRRRTKSSSSATPVEDEPGSKEPERETSPEKNG